MNGFPLSSPHQNLGEAEPRDTGAKELVQPSAIDLCWQKMEENMPD